ncbi:hypothetical protein [Bifidobacterium phasiani]|uniref:Uncharacterized protein n=1 Tax=Bifidobacterium phasiani TaxID=2834431 RepID=A0ABS6W6L1_9BIFI|nr:hypothetical protein [Bifidobacterium phasiani]MBW3081997.1 hypothetical protein [Bifidobacterium phasiani]
MRDRIGFAGLVAGVVSVPVDMWAVCWLLDGLSRGVVGTVEAAVLVTGVVVGVVGFHLWDRTVDA